MDNPGKNLRSGTVIPEKEISVVESDVTGQSIVKPAEQSPQPDMLAMFKELMLQQTTAITGLVDSKLTEKFSEQTELVDSKLTERLSKQTEFDNQFSELKSIEIQHAEGINTILESQNIIQSQVNVIETRVDTLELEVNNKIHPISEHYQQNTDTLRTQIESLENKLAAQKTETLNIVQNKLRH